MCSTSRNTTVPLGNPSRSAVAIASRASIAPRIALTYDAEHRVPVVATGADERRVMVRTRVFLWDFFDALDAVDRFTEGCVVDCFAALATSRPRVVAVTRRLEIVSDPLVLTGFPPRIHRFVAGIDVGVEAEMAAPVPHVGRNLLDGVVDRGRPVSQLAGRAT